MPSGQAKAETFVHLHNHTEYSMLDGAAKIDELCALAAEMGMPAIATTDHGNMFSAYEFYKTAKKHGLKPIIGTEAYLTPGTHRTDRSRVRWGNGGGDDCNSGSLGGALGSLGCSTGSLGGGSSASKLIQVDSPTVISR